MGSGIRKIIESVSVLLSEKKRLLIAIDGRCAAGKTTLAAHLQEQMDCAVFHVDDFFLRPEQRTAERLGMPGGNVDCERLCSEILLPLKNGADWITYQPYDCKARVLERPVKVRACSVNIVEGSYSCHPSLWNFYDLRIFLTVSAQGQRERILRRNGPKGAVAFRERWIPLEEQYFSAYQIEEHCNLRMEAVEL